MSELLLPYVNFVLFVALIYFFGKKKADQFAEKRRESYLLLYEKTLLEKKRLEAELLDVKTSFQELASSIEKMNEQAALALATEEKTIEADLKQMQERVRTETARMAETECLRAKESFYNELLVKVREQVLTVLQSESSSTKAIGSVDRVLPQLKAIGREA